MRGKVRDPLQQKVRRALFLKWPNGANFDEVARSIGYDTTDGKKAVERCLRTALERKQEVDKITEEVFRLNGVGVYEFFDDIVKTSDFGLLENIFEKRIFENLLGPNYQLTIDSSLATVAFTTTQKGIVGYEDVLTIGKRICDIMERRYGKASTQEELWTSALPSLQTLEYARKLVEDEHYGGLILANFRKHYPGLFTMSAAVFGRKDLDLQSREKRN